MLSAALSSASQALLFAVLIAACTAVAVLAAWARTTIKRERSSRAASDRAALQSHRVAETTGALVNARSSTDAITTAIHEPLHWLGAGAGVFFLLNGDSRHITVGSAVGYRLDHGESWDLDRWGEGSPFAESLRRLTPVVIRSAAARPKEYDEWSNGGPWKDHEASLVLPIAIERQVVGFLQIDFDEPREFSPDDYDHGACRDAEWHAAV
jgi:transcriptional regulator with GAF, ATPase, and Fis domain